MGPVSVLLQYRRSEQMKNVTISVDSAVYEFYRKVGLSAGGLPLEQVMADALFKLAGELSMQALHEKSAKK